MVRVGGTMDNPKSAAQVVRNRFGIRALGISVGFLTALTLVACCFTLLMYLEMKQDQVPPVIIRVIEVGEEDPRIVAYQLMLGRALEDNEDLVGIFEDQSGLVNRLLEGWIEDLSELNGGTHR